MENCPNCDVLLPKQPVGTGSLSRCPVCHQTLPAERLPLFIVTGTSGGGKTTAIPELRWQLPECAIFDTDWLWAADFHTACRDWLRIAYSLAQSGRYTVLCGTLLPKDLDTCPERTMVGSIHYLNLHASDEIREQRLHARPAWRKSNRPEFIAEHKRFARWLLDHAGDFDPPLRTIDTSFLPVELVALEVARWVTEIIASSPEQ